MDTLELEPGEYEAAVERARVRAETEPHATAARYDKRLRMVMVALHTGLTVAFRPADVQGLESATVADLSAIELDADGFGLHFPTLDADVFKTRAGGRERHGVSLARAKGVETPRAVVDPTDWPLDSGKSRGPHRRRAPTCGGC